MSHILSLDQGTTSSRTILIDTNGKQIGKAQKEFKQYFPKPSWVEHNPEEIWKSQLETINRVLSDTKVNLKDILGIGITNQRETVVAFDSKTGKPIHNAIVWQCRRTVQRCEELKLKYKSIIKEKTGLEIDAYFSGPKMEWIIENVKEAKELIKEKRLRFGTIDSWLIWNLTGKKDFYTDPSNASRTMLYNIKENKYDNELMSLFQIEEWMLPKVLKSNSEFGSTDPDLFGAPIPIKAVLGDQQAALFGNACFNTGDLKVTYGTGGFLLINIGEQFKLVDNLITTVAWDIDNGGQKTGNNPTYAIEGSTFISGAIIQWLRDGLGIIKDASETENLAISLDSNEGVYLVPALSGLGAPYWDGNARGIIIGLTRGTTKAHIVRAAVESMAYQIADLVLPIKELLTKESFIKADGGATKNNFLLQFQADLLNMNIVRSSQTEATAIGVAYLAGLSAGLWSSKEAIQKLWKTNELFLPRKDRKEEYRKWKEAVKRSFKWT